MKKYGNEAKIGDAALAFHYRPVNEKNWRVEVEINKKDNLNLEAEWYDPQSQIWIELYCIPEGIVEISKQDKFKSKDLLQFLAESLNNKKDVEKYSHIVIKRNWCSLGHYIHADHQTIKIYRLTPRLKKDILIRMTVNGKIVPTF